MSSKKKKHRNNIPKQLKENGNAQAADVIDTIDKLPSDEKQIVLKSIAMQYSGPLPMSSEFEKYEMVTPGAGDRIIGMAERQSQHRQDIEKHAVASQFKIAGRGQCFGFILGILGLGGGFWLISIDKDAYGVTSLVGTVATLVGVYIYGKKENRNE